MSKKPIEMMLDGVEWREAEPGKAGTPDEEMPYATHHGVLEIAGHKLRCYRLNTGQAVFNADDVRDFFGGVFKESA